MGTLKQFLDKLPLITFWFIRLLLYALVLIGTTISFLFIMLKVKPLALADFDVLKGNLTHSWNSIAGYETVIKRLRQLLEVSLQNQESYKRLETCTFSFFIKIAHHQVQIAGSFDFNIIREEMRNKFAS